MCGGAAYPADTQNVHSCLDKTAAAEKVSLFTRETKTHNLLYQYCRWLFAWFQENKDTPASTTVSLIFYIFLPYT